MSDRLYLQMREATGWCPGLPEIYKPKGEEKWLGQMKKRLKE